MYKDTFSKLGLNHFVKKPTFKFSLSKITFKGQFIENGNKITLLKFNYNGIFSIQHHQRGSRIASKV